ncbi:MAG: hypothetical protein ACLTS6_12200 [Anaerobutyricum sp.]
MKDVADGRATKIFIPNNLAEGVGPAAIAGEAFWGATKEPKRNSQMPKRKKSEKKDASKRRCLRMPV